MLLKCDSIAVGQAFYSCIINDPVLTENLRLIKTGIY